MRLAMLQKEEECFTKETENSLRSMTKDGSTSKNANRNDA